MDQLSGLSAESREISSLRHRIEAIENFLIKNFPKDACIENGNIKLKKEVEEQKKREEKTEKIRQQIREKHTDEDIYKYLKQVIYMTDQMGHAKDAGELE